MTDATPESGQQTGGGLRASWVVAGLVLGIFLAALESTVVATAMPRVIRELGGDRWYALPFSAYLLFSTVTSPLWGKASDLLGRRRLYLAGVVLFLAGSALCGVSRDMVELVAARCLQGLGAGSLITLTFTIVAELYALERRAKVQGFLSGVWGVAGLAGPLVGGIIVDHTSWRWVFFLNLPFGLLALLLVGAFYRDIPAQRGVRLDVVGALGFTAASGALVWGLENHQAWLVAAGAAGLAASLLFEARHPSPLLPLPALSGRLPRAALVGNLLAGAAYFGSVAYLPLFAQGVAGRSASAAGVVLTPMIVGWTLTSIAGAALLPKVGTRRMALWGFAMLVAAFAGFWALALSPLPALGADGFLAGSGMGFAMLALLVGTQEEVPRKDLGAVTAALVFARSMGGVLGVAAMHPLIGSIGDQTGLELAHGLRRAFLLGLALVATAWFLVARMTPRAQGASSSPT